MLIIRLDIVSSRIFKCGDSKLNFSYHLCYNMLNLLCPLLTYFVNLAVGGLKEFLTLVYLTISDKLMNNNCAMYYVLCMYGQL